MQQLRAALMALMVACTAFVAAPAGAQTGGQGGSFINPFPKDEVYRLHLVGDWFADGLRSAIAEALGEEAQIRTERNVLQVRSLRRSSWDQVINKVEAAGKRNVIDIAVVMFGAAEIGSLSVPGRRRIAFASEAWKTRYVRRVDRLMKALKQGGTAVYWLGLPTLRRNNRNEGAQFINEIIRERAYLNGVKFIDTYAGFADENGNYDPYGPDLTGKISRLRSRDGVYFTPTGYQKLAHFASRLIARDLRRAKSERTIPLAAANWSKAGSSRQPTFPGTTPGRPPSQRLSSANRPNWPGGSDRPHRARRARLPMFPALRTKRPITAQLRCKPSPTASPAPRR